MGKILSILIPALKKLIRYLNAKHEEYLKKNCKWCGGTGWYYPTGDGMPEKMRCDHN